MKLIYYSKQINLRILACLIVLLLSISSVSLAEQPIKVGVYNFEPLIFMDDKGDTGGLYLDVLEHIAEIEGWKIEYVFGSWNECLGRLERGEIDLLPGIAYSEERARYLDFTKEFLFLDWGLVYVKKGSPIHTVFDLEGATISVLKGSIYTEGFKKLLDQFGINASFKEKDEYAQVFESIDSNEVDAGINALVSGIRTEGNYDIEQTHINFSPVKIRFAVGKNRNANILKKLDGHISALKADKHSIYHRLFDKWMGFHREEKGLPQWVQWAVGITVFFLLIAFSFSIILRKRVHTRTSELKAANTALRESKERYRILVEFSPVPILIHQNGILKYLNPAAIKMHGAERIEQLINKPLLEFVHADYRELIKESILGHLEAARKERHSQIKIVRLDNRILDIEVSSIPIQYEEGDARLVIFSDITKRKQSEDTLREREAFIRTVLDNLPVGIAVNSVDPNVTFDYMNDNFAKFYRTTKENLARPDAFWESVYEDSEFREKMKKRVLDDCASGDPGLMCWEDVPIARKGEETAFITARNIPISDEQFMISTVWDVTERKKAEEALRLTQYSVDHSTDAAFWIYNDGRFKYVNESACRSLGYSYEELCFMTVHDIDPAFQEKRWIGLLKEIREKHSMQFESHHCRKDGTVFPVEINIDLLEFEKTEYIFAFARDISDRKKLQGQLVQAQKMESIGTLAGGIAHDFNNILTSIVGFAYLAKMKSSKDSEGIPYINLATEAANRATDLVKQILTFSRMSDQELQPIMIWPTVKDAIKLLRASIPTTIEIRQNISPVGSVMVDPTQIYQTVMNLCTNAYHAMQETGGVMGIDLQEVNVDADFASLHIDLVPGQYVRLTVSDTGRGIDPAMIDRIFDPYFTTKEKGKGTGLGLSVVHGIIKRYGGTITVASELSKGTRFEIYLPVVQKEAKAEVKTGQPLVAGTETVLIVDDEQSMVMIGSEILESLGYKVVGCTDSQEALKQFREDPDKFDLVFTDMTMPKMTGLMLVREILGIRPDMPVILATGFSEGLEEDIVKKAGIRKLLMKPFTPEKLSQTIRRVLDGNSDGRSSEHMLI